MVSIQVAIKTIFLGIDPNFQKVVRVKYQYLVLYNAAFTARDIVSYKLPPHSKTCNRNLINTRLDQWPNGETEIIINNL